MNTVKHGIYNFVLIKNELCADPYVKLYLLHDGQRLVKKKTHVKKRTLNPVFNESFVFDLPAGTQSMEKVSLAVSLLDWDRVTKNEVCTPKNTLLFVSYIH